MNPNTQAQVSSESRVLSTVLALTSDIKDTVEGVNDQVSTIEDDLNLRSSIHS